MEAWAEHASLIVTAASLLAYLASLLWERVAPAIGAMSEAIDMTDRWTSNFGLLVVNHGVAYAVVPAIAVFSAWCSGWFGLGLLPRAEVPMTASMFVALLALDFNGWAVHRALHRFKPLWRVHEVHHNDRCFDVSLAFRFHPLEPALVSLCSSVVIVVLGLPVIAVLLASLLGAVHNVWVHANGRLADSTERVLRRLIVTPDVHRVHHSVKLEDSMRNFGIIFPWWDVLFGTWRTPVGAGALEFGVADASDLSRPALGRLLLQPFRLR